MATTSQAKATNAWRGAGDFALDVAELFAGGEGHDPEPIVTLALPLKAWFDLAPTADDLTARVTAARRHLHRLQAAAMGPGVGLIESRRRAAEAAGNPLQFVAAAQQYYAVLRPPPGTAGNAGERRGTAGYADPARDRWLLAWLVHAADEASSRGEALLWPNLVARAREIAGHDRNAGGPPAPGEFHGLAMATVGEVFGYTPKGSGLTWSGIAGYECPRAYHDATDRPRLEENWTADGDLFLHCPGRGGDGQACSYRLVVLAIGEEAP